jgi:FKBP-type peptidyl-prolyl cis-trans isomerase
MKTGEKASMFLPYYLAFGNASSSTVPAYSPIRMVMEFIKTRTEVQQINDFLLEKKYTVSERSADNLVIIRTNTVTGDTLGSGKSVNVKYVVKFLDGTKVEEGTTPVVTNTGGVILGFDRAVRRMRKTEKAIVIFPSALGYKETGKGSVPGYTPLVFELEILP